jgi:uncharacterized membrane protein
MSLLLTRVPRTLIVAALAALLCALAVFSQAADAASKRSTRAERALTVAAAHKYGIGTKTTSRCAKVKGFSGWRCAWAARPRGKKTVVYVGRASVNRKLKVRFTGRAICVGAGCKK